MGWVEKLPRKKLRNLQWYREFKEEAGVDTCRIVVPFPLHEGKDFTVDFFPVPETLPVCRSCERGKP